MKFSFAGLKRTAVSVFAGGALLVAGTGLEAFAQKPHKEHKDHQKTEKRELREHQRTERRTLGNSRELRRHQKAERRTLKRHQRAEDRRWNRRHARPGYYSNNGRRMYRFNRPSWARARRR